LKSKYATFVFFIIIIFEDLGRCIGLGFWRTIFA